MLLLLFMVFHTIGRYAVVARQSMQQLDADGVFNYLRSKATHEQVLPNTGIVDRGAQSQQRDRCGTHCCTAAVENTIDPFTCTSSEAENDRHQIRIQILVGCAVE